MKIFNFIKNSALWNQDDIFQDILSDPDFDFLKSDSPDLLKKELCEMFFLEPDVVPSASLVYLEQEILDAIKVISEDFYNLNPCIYVFGMSAKNERAINRTFGISATAGTRRIILSVDLASWRKGHVKTCIVHELNHVARLQYFSFFKSGNLLDWMIFEGLTELYQIEKLTDHQLSLWCTTADSEDLDRFFPLAKREFRIPNADSKTAKNWMFGDGEIPEWFGYALGFDIVKAFRSRNPTAAWSNLITIPSEAFMDGYRR